MSDTTGSTTNQDEVSMYQDLIGFLQSNRSDLRVAATEAALAVKDDEGMTKLVHHGVVAPLVKLTSHSGPVGVNALTALVELSSHGPSAAQCVDELLDNNALNRLTEIALSKREEEESLDNWKQRVNLSLALVVNLTRTERGAIDFCGKTLPDEAVQKEDLNEESLESRPRMELLLARFLSTQYIDETPAEEENTGETTIESAGEPTHNNDPYQHFASILMNGTQIEAGRKFVLRLHHSDNIDETTSVLQRLLPQLRSQNVIRRRGVAGTIKNCCLETDSAWWLLHEVKIIKFLLYPLAGPEELDADEKRGMDVDLWIEGPDKVREVDGLTRLHLVESILLLCASGRKSREHIRLQRTYVILKWADMVEEREDVSDRINDCVQYLRRDEEGTAEGSSDAMVEASLNQQRLALPAPSASNQVNSLQQQDYDDVD